MVAHRNVQEWRLRLRRYGYAFSDSELMISRAASLDRGLIEHGNGSGALGTGQDPGRTSVWNEDGT